MENVLGSCFTVGQLEHALLGTFPAADAAEWDRTGLQVGNPAQAVKRVAVALDPTVENIRDAALAQCNVLVTHHPPFLSAPDLFMPGGSALVATGANVFEAARLGVALMCFHTALDFNPRGYRVMPSLLDMSVSYLLDETSGSTQHNGYGCVCELDEPTTLRDVAQLCHERFGSHVQVWGDLDAPVRTVCTGQGSAGSLAGGCVARGIDVLVCGEMKYHAALDLMNAGTNIVALGHDVSENPFVDVLVDEIVSLGVARADIECITRENWTTL